MTGSASDRRRSNRLRMPEIYEALEERGVKYAIRIPAGWRPSKKPQVEYEGYLYHAASWKMPRRVVANAENRAGELFPRVGFIVTN